MLSRSRKAFTLIELIVVIVILGILAALAIPTFQAVIEKAKFNTAKTAAESIGRDAYALASFTPEDVTDPVADSLDDELAVAVAEAGGNATVSAVASDVDNLVIDGYTLELQFSGSKVEAVDVTPAG